MGGGIARPVSGAGSLLTRGAPVALVALGGACGSVARYGLALAGRSWSDGRLPWGTWAANLLGCFLLGGVAELASRAGGLSEQGRLFWATGVMGGLTTYSTYNYETIVMHGARGALGRRPAQRGGHDGGLPAGLPRRNGARATSLTRRKRAGGRSSRAA
ncbi:MAG: CrcB family protein [Polyangiaceae bacterium]|nr:CrcB family protein [Polyangiaceae bacterium]